MPIQVKTESPSRSPPAPSSSMNSHMLSHGPFTISRATPHQPSWFTWLVSLPQTATSSFLHIFTCCYPGEPSKPIGNAASSMKPSRSPSCLLSLTPRRFFKSSLWHLHVGLFELLRHTLLRRRRKAQCLQTWLSDRRFWTGILSVLFTKASDSILWASVALFWWWGIRLPYICAQHDPSRLTIDHLHRFNKDQNSLLLCPPVSSSWSSLLLSWHHSLSFPASLGTGLS